MRDADKLLALIQQARSEYRASDAAGDVLDWLEERALAQPAEAVEGEDGELLNDLEAEALLAWPRGVEQRFVGAREQRIAKLCKRAIAALAHGAAQGAVALVPVHPKHGPLWGDTYPAGDAADGRSPHYERMPLFTHPQAAPAQVAVAWYVFADTEKWVTLDRSEADDQRAEGCQVRPLIFGDTHPQAAPAQGDGWRLCYSAVIHALAAIVNIRCPDKLFDLDAIPRGPVMDQVVIIREAMDRFGKARAAAPSQERE